MHCKKNSAHVFYNMPDSSTHEKTGRISAVGKSGVIDGRETSPRLVKVNIGSPNHLANFFASSFAYSFVMSSSMAISYTPEYQVENLSPVHM